MVFLMETVPFIRVYDWFTSLPLKPPVSLYARTDGVQAYSQQLMPKPYIVCPCHTTERRQSHMPRTVYIGSAPISGRAKASIPKACECSWSLVCVDHPPGGFMWRSWLPTELDTNNTSSVD